MLRKVAIFGIGEAGSLFAGDLVDRGLTVSAYDPADVPTPNWVERCADPVEAVTDADFVFGVTAAADAAGALHQAIDAIPSSALYADFATGSRALKRELAERAAEKGFAFTDVALLAIVPGNGIKAKSLASGTGARRFAQEMQILGMPVEVIDGEAGEAATRKLLRSVMMKGLAAVTIEALRAAEAAGCRDWLWDNLVDQVTRADEATLARLVAGTGQHAERRRHEMEASTALLEELGVDPVMTRSTVESLRRIPTEDVPAVPKSGGRR